MIKKNPLHYSNIRISGGMIGRIPIQTAIYKNKMIFVLLRNGLLVAYTQNSLKLLWSVVVYDKRNGITLSQRKKKKEEEGSIDTDLVVVVVVVVMMMKIIKQCHFVHQIQHYIFIQMIIIYIFY